jgi:general secretion pathway protein C
LTGSRSGILSGGSAVENIRRGLVRFAGPAIMVTEVAMVAGLAVIATKIGWLLIEPGGSILGQQPLSFQKIAAEEGATNLTGDMTLLVTSNPFSRAAETAAVIQEAPETKLNLVLKGVRASANGTGVAMIVMPNNRLNIFAPGETILDGVVLDRVYGDRVTLRKDGQIEALLMSSGADRLSVLSSPGDIRPKTSGGSQAAGDDLISTTATDFLANLVINPVHRGSDFVGYEISSRGDAALLERSGLKPGDIVLSVDGVSIGATAPGELAMKLSSSRKVRLRIDRDGRQVDQIFTLPENP